jgi:hypothetical protein
MTTLHEVCTDMYHSFSSFYLPVGTSHFMDQDSALEIVWKDVFIFIVYTVSLFCTNIRVCPAVHLYGHLKHYFALFCYVD